MANDLSNLLHGDPSLPQGTPIKGLFEFEVEGLRAESKTKEDLYKNTINLWLWKSQDHLTELMEVLQSNKERRALSNPIGMNKSKSMGGGISMPTGLFIALKKVEEDLFDNVKKLNYFKKKFPQFKVY